MDKIEDKWKCSMLLLVIDNQFVVYVSSCKSSENTASHAVQNKNIHIVSIWPQSISFESKVAEKNKVFRLPLDKYNL